MKKDNRRRRPFYSEPIFFYTSKNAGKSKVNWTTFAPGRNQTSIGPRRGGPHINSKRFPKYESKYT